MDFKTLPSQYDHAAAQAKWYPEWERRGYFHAEADDPRPAFSIVIPPPNVTGALHLGHALNNTLQDILVRMKRMQGSSTLWMPGTDHAGIATQAVVERRLFEEEKKTRHDLGREGLVDRIWKWKDQYEARILSQLKQLGCSCDWDRTRFTLDDQCAMAVREWFFRLFKDRKIYRGKRLVNWDTFLQTAVSDDEVFKEPIKGYFWHFKYPVIDPRPGEPEFVTIATTRPETMLGDTAVAVHPDPARALEKAEAELQAKLAAAPAKERGEIEAQIESLANRRKSMLPLLVQLRGMAQRGVMLELPLTGRRIPLIADEWAKPELGSGAVKITPAHDENDYAVGQRHPEIGAINIMHPDGTLNDSVPAKYHGLKMHTTARQAVVADMEATVVNGVQLFNPETDREDREIELPHSDRSKTPIEPYLADQWFMRMEELAQSAMDAVTDGRVRIVPERYAKGYLDWLSEKRDWPIGRQLWWGHRIPVWSKTFAAADFSAAMQQTPIAEASLDDILNHDPLGNSHLYMKCDWSRIAWDAQLGPGDGEATVFACVNCGCEDEEAMLEAAGFRQETDVLDTWFSSALWPMSTLGWPAETPELATFYPTSTLVTSRDIITLWVARMVLAGLYNMGAVPFHEVYITPKILDGYGETMSKSKGNGVDPLDIIEKFGADALRFGIAYLTTDTQDVKLPVEFECPHCKAVFAQTKKNRQLPRIECEKCGQPFSTQWAEKPEDKALPRGAMVSERFELGRKFCNKLWNAARFSLINLEGYEPGPVTDKDLLLEDRWLLSRLATVTDQVTERLETYRYAEAARALYDFAWNEFCSFYVEMTKARFAAVPAGGDLAADGNLPATPAGNGVGDASHKTSGGGGDGSSKTRATAQRVLAHALDVLMRLLHPITPFLTEEVWHLLGQVAPSRGLPQPREPRASDATGSICIAPWPLAEMKYQDSAIEEQFAVFQAVLGFLRETRQTRNIPQRDELPFVVRCDGATAKLLAPMQPYFTQMAPATMTACGPEATAPDRPASATLAGQHGPIEVHVDLARFIDPAAERKQLEKQRGELVKFIESIDKKLANKAFVDKAPAEVVQQQRDKQAELRQQLASVEAALGKL